MRWTAEIAYDVAAAWERSGQPVRAHRAFAELARDGRASEAVRAAALARAGALRGRVGVLVVRIRGTQERLIPVLMTALAAGIALIPLILAADEPGKEILNPVAIVIVGGLLSSTLLGLGITPALFQTFCRRAAEQAVARKAPATH